MFVFIMILSLKKKVLVHVLGMIILSSHNYCSSCRDLSSNNLDGSIPTNKFPINITTMYVNVHILIIYLTLFYKMLASEWQSNSWSSQISQWSIRKYAYWVYPLKLVRSSSSPEIVRSSLYLYFVLCCLEVAIIIVSKLKFSQHSK